MLSLPDFKQKQIIYIECTKNKKIHFLNQNLIVEEKQINPETKRNKYKITNQVPCGKIFCVFIIGNFTFTNILIQRFIKHGISIFFLNFNFRCYSSFSPKTEGNVLLRKKQYTLTEKRKLEISKEIIFNKTYNQLKLLKNIRQKDEKTKLKIDKVNEIQEKILKASNQKTLLGYEGNISKIFFSIYFSEMNWKGRKPQTKYDITNTLLDRGYTTLFNFIESLLRIYGFDIYSGIYHQFFFQRKSLVCDLVEPFRCIIDQSLRKSNNLKIIDRKDFEIYNNQYYLPYKNNKKYSKIFLEAILKHKEEIFLYIQNYYRCFITDKKINTNFII